MGYRRATIALIWAHAAVMLAAVSASAQTVVKVGLISSYSGFVAQAADEAQKGIDLYLKEHERDLSPGVKVELIRRDDTPIWNSASGSHSNLSPASRSSC